MASPTIDNSVVTNTGANITSITLTLTTSLTNDIIVVAISVNGSSGNGLRTVSHLNSTNLPQANWAQRASYVVTGANSSHQDLEIWWIASTGALTSEVITVTLSGSTADVSAMAFGVNGCGSLTSPWDPNSALGGSPPTAIAADVSGASTTPTITSLISTTNKDNLIFTFMNATGSVGYAETAGTINGNTATLLASPHEGGGANASTCAAQYVSVSAAVTTATGAFNPLGTQYWNIIADALTADASAPPPGLPTTVGFAASEW